MKTMLQHSMNITETDYMTIPPKSAPTFLSCPMYL